MTLDDLLEEYRNVLNYSDHNLAVVTAAVATVLTSQFPGSSEAVWTNIIGPSGCGKSEVLLSMSGTEGWGTDPKAPDFRSPAPRPWTITRESISAKALASGLAEDSKLISKGADPSLLSKANRKCLIIQDTSQMESMKRDEVLALQADLRAAHGGRVRKAFGTGDRDYTAKLSFLFGATPSFDRFLIRFQRLGGRALCIRYWLTVAEYQKYARQALRKASSKHIWFPRLQQATVDVLQPVIADLPSSPLDLFLDLPPDIENRLVAISLVGVLAKTFPLIDSFAINPIIKGYETPEMPTRLSKSLSVIGWAVARLRRETEWSPATLDFLARLAWDTIPNLGQRVFALLYPDGISRAEMFARLNVSPSLAAAVMTQYAQTGVVTETSTPGLLRLSDWILEACHTAWPDTTRTWWPRSAFTSGVVI